MNAPPAQSSQPKPESWQEIAMEAATDITNRSSIEFSCFADYDAKRGKIVNEILLPVILSAIERSHAVLITCRDHWKTSFKNERANVIRLRQIVYKFHSDDCVCEDCNLVRSHTPAQPQQ